VLITTNFAHELDEALTRLGCIDQKFLVYLCLKTALQMFIGMFAPVHAVVSRNADLDLGDDGIRELALAFSSHIPENSFIPAQIRISASLSRFGG
jgi:mitochondrial chaperone BCS1